MFNGENAEQLPSAEESSQQQLDTPVHIDIPEDTSDSTTKTAASLSSPGKVSPNPESSTDQTSSFYEQELTRLRSIITQQNLDNLALEQRLTECEQQAKQKCDELNANFTLKLEQTLKSFTEGQNEKTSSLVMKYAQGEKKCIELNRSIEHLKSKLDDSAKEKKRLNERFEKETAEKKKLNGEYEKKIVEIMNMKKEMIKLKETIIVAEAREKTAQAKLKLECEAHNSCKKLLEESELNLAALKTPPADTNLDIETTNKDDNEKSSEQKLPEIFVESAEANAPLGGIEASRSASVSPTGRDQVKQDSLQVKELQTLKSQLKDMFEERTTLRDSLACMEKERKLQEASLVKFKETLQSQKQMNKDLLTEILQLRELNETLTNEKDQKVSLEQRLKMLTSELEEVQEEMSLSQIKQTELLAFNLKLTEKNSWLQSEVTILDDKLKSAEADLKEKTSRLCQNDLATKQSELALNSSLAEALNRIGLLEAEIVEKTEQIQKLTVNLSDEQDELISLKKKHQANIKDLSRQLSVVQKKLNQQTSSAPQAGSINPSTKHSRTNSVTSLTDNGEQHVFNSASSSFSLNEDTQSLSRYSEVTCSGGGGSNGVDDVYVVDVDKQKIIEKVVQLQKMLAKKNEKIDFLQDHVNQLTRDLKRKTKIIQAYAMTVPDLGAFTSEQHDAMRLELNRKTGALSNNNNKSYLQFIKFDESHMTKELCMEVNNKLQALLEDTLVKNLTLKDSLDTLGQEIARLSKENRHICMNKD